MAEDLTSYKMACVVARFLDEKIAKDISILNISNVSSFADYFVICSAQSNTQVKALTENLADKVKQTFSRLPLGKENDVKKVALTLMNNQNVIIVLDNENNLIGYQNQNATVIEDNFLEYDVTLRKLEMANVKEIGNNCLRRNDIIEEINFP